MTRTSWPSFITCDLGDTPEDDAEMQRRWEIYNSEMQLLISAGGVRQDADGWWIDDATGELIGPDPEIERPRTEEELAGVKPFAKVFPDLHASIVAIRKRGPTRTKTPVTIRLDDAVVFGLRATGPGWQTRVNDVLKEWLEKAS